MKIVTLDNGLKVVYEYKKSNSTIIQVNVRVGSNYEDKNNLGICHFIEHMLFEGTKKRDARQIALEVEKMGGQINAFTLKERTSYYVSVLNKHFDKGLNVLSDMIRNPLFSEKSIEKEKKIVLDEKKIFLDDPNSYQWLLFLNKLYKKHPAKWCGLGDERTINPLTRKDIINFYKKYYAPNNITLVVVGGAKNAIPKIKKEFSDFKKIEIQKYKSILEPEQKIKESIIERKNIEHSYYIFGYKTAKRDDKDSYALDIISCILGYGQSSRLFNEMRIKRGIGYSVGVLNDLNKDYGYFACFVTTDKKNINEVRKIITEQMSLSDLSNEEIEQAKDMIEGITLIRNEENKEKSDWISYWDLIEKRKNIDNYIDEIRKIKMEDVKKVIKKYFTGNYTEIILEEN